jgi:hypothetical protein
LSQLQDFCGEAARECRKIAWAGTSERVVSSPHDLATLSYKSSHEDKKKGKKFSSLVLQRVEDFWQELCDNPHFWQDIVARSPRRLCGAFQDTKEIRQNHPTPGGKVLWQNGGVIWQSTDIHD